MEHSPERGMKHALPYMFLVTLRGYVRGDDAVVVEGLDKVMDELEHLRAVDPVIDLNLEKHEVGFEVVVQAENAVTAVNYASGLLRSAVHAVGGATPNWPGLEADIWSIQLIGITSEQVNNPQQVAATAV